MRIGDVFCALIEVAGPDDAYKGMYEPNSLPAKVSDEDLALGAMPSARDGLFGFQHYCTLSGRPMCLFVVTSCSEAWGGVSLDSLNELVGSITVDPWTPETPL